MKQRSHKLELTLHFLGGGRLKIKNLKEKIEF